MIMTTLSLLFDRASARRHALLGLAAAAWLTLTACDNFESPTELPAPSVTFQAVLAPLGAEVHVITVPEEGVVNVELTAIEAQQVNDTFDDSGLGLTLRLARVDNNCEEGAPFNLREGQSLVFELVEASYCINVSEPGLLPETAMLAYTISVSLP